MDCVIEKIMKILPSFPIYASTLKRSLLSERKSISRQHYTSEVQILILTVTTYTSEKTLTLFERFEPLGIL